MSAFAASYYNESNNVWLNDLVGDIIDPGSRSKSTACTSLQSSDLYDDVDDCSEADMGNQSAWSRESHRRGRAPRVSSRRASLPSPTSVRSPSSVNRLAQYTRGGSVSRNSHHSTTEAQGRATPARDIYIEPISEDGGPLSLNPYYQPPQHYFPDVSREPAAMTRSTPLSQRALLSHSRQSQSLSQTEHSGSSLHDVAARLTSLSPPPMTSDQRKLRPSSEWSGKTSVADLEKEGEEMPSRYAPSKTSLGRTMTEKRFHDLMQKPPLARVTSSATDVANEAFTGFSPHPAVRPFSDREKLGEAAGPGEEDDHEYPKPFALALIILGICLSVFIISVDRNIVTTAIPQITETFRSYTDIGWYGSAYFLTASAFQPLYGRVYMSFDTRWTFLLALAIFEVGSLLGALSPNSDTLILGRAIQGLGSAGILTGSFVVGTHSVPLQGRPILFAFVGILYGVGALAGPLLGGVFTDLLNWRWAFWINLPIGAVTFVGIFFFFKPRKNKNQHQRPSFVSRILKLDLIGNAILLGACVMLFLALQMSETSGSWNNAPVIGLLCGFGATTIIFIAWLFYRGNEALIPPRIARQRTVAASCGIAFFLYGGLLIHAYYLPIWFQAIKGDSAIQSGVNMIPYMVANAVFALLAGIFVSKNGLFAPPAIIGCAIGTVGCGLLSTIGPNTSTATWVGYEFLVSAGLGIAIQQGFSAVQTALPLEEVPIGTAAVVACQSLGGAVFVSIGNTILQDHLLNQNDDNAIPGVNIRAVFEMGATMFRGVVPAESLPALIQLYNRSLQYVFIASIPLIGCAFLCALGMEWNSVKNKQGMKKKCNETEKA